MYVGTNIRCFVYNRKYLLASSIFHILTDNKSFQIQVLKVLYSS